MWLSFLGRKKELCPQSSEKIEKEEKSPNLKMEHEIKDETVDGITDE